MKPLQQHLINYARYHRDPRNIITHFIGIPLIVLSLILLLSILTINLPSFSVNLGSLVALVLCVYYLKLDIKLGMVMSFFMAVLCFVANWVQLSDQPFAVGVIMFVIGWLFQFVGHYFEGKKPAFVDDLMGLVIGPLFVVVEMLFLLGCFKNLQYTIEQHAGIVIKQT